MAGGGLARCAARLSGARVRERGKPWRLGQAGPVREGKEEKVGWVAWAGLGRWGLAVWAGLCFSFWVWAGSSSSFLLQTSLKLFEFKFDFEFKPHSIN